MPALWAILLDVSGSMAEGFSTPPSNDPFEEHGLWDTKLHAAKDLLLLQIIRLREQEIAVYTFADTTKKIFQGTRDDFAEAESKIRNIEADGHTNLASALVAVTEDPALENYIPLTVLILSDGLSNLGDPKSAAQRLVEKFPHCRIDTILIDETPEGRRTAEDVSIGGDVRSAASKTQVSREVVSARAGELAHELASLPYLAFNAESELARITGGPSPTLLTVTTPLSLTAASLDREIVPTLQALEALGRARTEGLGLPFRGKINSISQSSPISISLSGLKEAVELALEWVIPWRRENAKRIANAKARQAEIQNERDSVHLMDEKLALAERMLTVVAPKARGTQRQAVLRQLLEGIDRMSEASVDFAQQATPGSGRPTLIQ
jgi:hypothetical protein